jgi:hypothetical protein
MSITNIANVILLTAVLYFGFQYGFYWWICLLGIFAVASWEYHGFSKERKRQFEAQTELLKAKAEYYKRRTKCLKTI